MDRDEILRLTKNGHFFRVNFIKANGDLRKMTARMGVKKYLRGGEKRFKDEDYNIVTVFEPSTKTYKSFRVDRLVSLKVDGKTYKGDA